MSEPKCTYSTAVCDALQEQQATVDAAEEATRAYQAQIAQLHQEYQARHAQRGPAIAQVRWTHSSCVQRRFQNINRCTVDS